MLVNTSNEVPNHSINSASWRDSTGLAEGNVTLLLELLQFSHGKQISNEGTLHKQNLYFFKQSHRPKESMSFINHTDFYFLIKVNLQHPSLFSALLSLSVFLSQSLTLSRTNVKADIQTTSWKETERLVSDKTRELSFFQLVNRTAVFRFRVKVIPGAMV